MGLWALAIGLDFSTEKLLKEVQALPPSWEDLDQGDISLVVLHFILLHLVTCLVVFTFYRSACLDRVRDYWKMLGIFLLVFLVDWENEEDTRTGLPKLAQDEATKIIGEAFMGNRSLEETLAGLFQHIRKMKMPISALEAKIKLMLKSTNLYNFSSIVTYAGPCICNLLLAWHFGICSHDYFMIVF